MQKPTMILLLAALAVWVFNSQSFAADQKSAALAKQAEAILTKNCHRCHGENGRAENDFYVLVSSSLVPRRVKPGKPDESLLIRKVRSGDMPPDDKPLSADDQKVLEDWVRIGAPDFNPPIKRRFLSPIAVLDALAADLARLSDDDRPFARYFTITHLYNAELSDDELETYRGAISKLVNSLSWRPEIVPPSPIDREKTIFRIDLRNYRWNAKTWDAIVASNPYAVTVGAKSAQYCAKETGSPLPVVRGDWFVFAASRPALYHDILQMPQTDLELEKVLQVDVAENIRTKQVHRAGFTESGVSDNNRLIERHESPPTRGAYWKSYDFKNNEGPKNLQAHPLGPIGLADNPFEQDGGEIIFNLPNGLQAYMLIDAKGKRIDTGPPEVVHDDAQKGRLVVNGISCMSCHNEGMKLKDDAIRNHVEANLASFSKDEVAKVRALYPSTAQFAKLQQKDAKRFTDAVKETGVARLGKNDPIVTLAKRFEASLDVKLAAAEVGLPVDKFLAGLEKSPALSRDLGLLKVAGQTVKRDLFVRTFGTIVRDLGLGTFLPPTRSPAATTAPAGDTITNSIGMELVLIPPGEFTMGSPKSEKDRDKDEDQVSVTLTKGFWLGKYEVTQGQWKQVMGTTPWKENGKVKDYVKEGDDYPATYLRWDDAVKFLDKFTRQERAAGRLPAGQKYTLPTEAQWEHACRAGSKTTTRFSFGNDESALNDYAWFDKNAWNAGENYAHQVGTKKANAWGLHDMHGNVWEWCRDMYGRKLPGGTDPEVASGGSFPVSRGGGWFLVAAYCRSANRRRDSPDFRSYDLGFRVALSSSQ